MIYQCKILNKNIKFQLIWNKINNTYWLNDIYNNKYETNIIKERNFDNYKNQFILNGIDIINLLFINHPIFKNIKDNL